MSASWIVNVGGRAYGPYTDAQMAAFVTEGRLGAQSLVARSGESDFRTAAEDKTLGKLFDQPEPVHEPEPKPVHVFGKNRDESQKSGETAHIVIIADMKSRSITGLEEAIHRLGKACPLLPQIWLLKTDKSVNAVRNTLVQQLGKLDVLFVADATNDKAAWFNFGPEVEARIRRVWSRDQDEPLSAAS
jgi:hypothetical protein